MTALLSSLPFVGLFLKFMVASSVLLGAVWLLERLRVLRFPDLRELAWKLALTASFVALLPIGNWVSGPITIHHTEARTLVKRFDSGQPLSSFIHHDTAPGDTVGEWLPNRGVTLKGTFKVEGVQGQGPFTLDLSSVPDAEATAVIAKLPAEIKQAVATKVTVERTQAVTQGPHDNGTQQKPEAGSEDHTIASSWGQWVTGMSARALAAGTWGLFALLALTALGFGYRSAIRDLGTRVRVDAEDPANRELRALCVKADIRHVPYLSRSSDIASPVCLPGREICLPDWAFDALPEREIRSLLAHELGHMIRRDPLMLMVLQLLSRLFFFQPLFSVARRRLADLAELAADEWAAKQLADPRAVATALFTCATKIHDSKNLQWGLAMAGNKSMLKIRVERLVGANGAHFHTASKAAKGALLAGVIGLTLGLPSFEFANATSVDNTRDEKTSGHYGLSDDDKARLKDLELKVREQERAARELERAARKQEQMARKQERLAHAAEMKELARLRVEDHDHEGHIEIDRDDGNGNIVLSDKDRSVKASWEGHFTLNDTLDGIADVDRGAWVELKTSDDKGARTARFEREHDKLVQSYWVAGTKQEMDDAGRKWLKATISELTERTGWHAEERVAMLLKKGGPKAVLKLIESSKEDYLKRVYTQHLIEQADLKGHDLDKLIDLLAKLDSDYEKRVAFTMLLSREKLDKKVLDKVLKAAKTMDSDYEKRQLLTPFLIQYPLDDKAIDMLIDMADQMKSDYELRNLLVVGLHDKTLSQKAVERVVKIATDKIDSDYELRQLMGALAGQLDKSADATKVLLDAIGKQDSDYEKRMTLDIVMSQGAMNTKNWEAAIEVASHIDSDYEKAQALLHVRAMMPEDKGLQQKLAKAVETIESKYERNRLNRKIDMIGGDMVPPTPPVPDAQPAPEPKPAGSRGSV